ncbi:N-acetylmuramoyl-L-alanine amidase [Dictyobacter formicarum]|uniref:N-acetylmuramoyl-L-alanine amidase n=1 Tax=Dictyobacter formicarum TaxID=2778368 RepID=A0ABQ3VLL0_9CHLR|nr:peptidoglycan recognition family protein [Dictyobacter formicarum]GHO86584.1 amidase [Dictyobacter formicarum]
MCIQNLLRPYRSFPVLVLVGLLVSASVLKGMWSSHEPQVHAAGNLNQVFAQAAAEFAVPVPLLKALCYMEGRLSNHGGTPSIDGGYGCMHLMTTHRNSSLMLAARDLRADPAVLKTDLATNIRGGAAALRDYWRQLSSGRAPAKALDAWYKVLSMYSGASSAAVGQMYADAVYKIINQGFVARAEKGEIVTLAAQHVVPRISAMPISATKHYKPIGAMSRSSHSQIMQPDSAALPKGCSRDGNTDYPGAIDCILDANKFDCNSVDDNAPCTYESSDRPADYPVDFVGIHDIEGSAMDAINYFHNVKAAVSTHYVVDTDGTVYQIMHDTDIAYHMGNYWYNQRAIGIEHAGYAATGYQWYNAAMYLASAKLVAYLLKKYHLPFDRAHIIGHGDVPAPSVALMPNHVDPGPYWLWGYYFSLIGAQDTPDARHTAFSANVISVDPPFNRVPVGSGGQETEANYNFFSLYNGPSTNSGLVPHAGHSITDETSNIEPGISYAYTNVAMDQASTGMAMYQIWYGVESHLKDKKPSHLCSARQVWLAVPPGSISRGMGMLIALGTATKVYGKPEQKNDYQIGDAPQRAIFVSAFGVQDDKNNYWYEINFNHRQAWVPETAVNL